MLGPLFFILYVNDVQFAVQNSEIQLYADDTVIHLANENLSKAANDLQGAINQFTQWCQENKLSLNTSKTKQMSFGTRSKVKRAKNVQLTA